MSDVSAEVHEEPYVLTRHDSICSGTSKFCTGKFSQTLPPAGIGFVTLNEKVKVDSAAIC